MFESETSEAAALLSLLAVSVAVPRVRGRRREARARFVRRDGEADQHEG